MIRNFRITYDNFETPLQVWQFQNPFLHALAVGTLATVLAYQGTAIFLDIFLGNKKRDEVTHADLFILLRTEDSSLSFKTTLFFLKTMFGNSDGNPRNPDKSRKVLGAGYRPILKLLSLLILIPTVNLICIIITLERDIVLSFRDARFGGMAVGSRADIGSFTVRSDAQTSVQCFFYSINSGSRDLPLAEIFFCSEWGEPLGIQADNFTVKTVVSRSSEGDVTLGVVSLDEEKSLFIRTSLNIWTSGKSYRVKSILTSKEASRIAQDGANRILQLCPNSSIKGSQPQLLPPESDLHEETFTVSQPFLCNDTAIGQLDIIIAILEMERYLGPVDSETFEVAETRDSFNPTFQAQFKSGDNLPLLRRRSPYVSFFSMLLATGCVCVIRVIVGFATNNDIHLGLELIVKRYADIYCCDSMLQNQSVINYTGTLLKVKGQEAAISS